MAKNKCKVDPITAKALKASNASKQASQANKKRSKQKTLKCQEMNQSESLSNYFRLIKQTMKEA